MPEREPRQYSKSRELILNLLTAATLTQGACAHDGGRGSSERNEKQGEVEIKRITLDNIDDYLNNKRPVILFTSAKWCGPCKDLKRGLKKSGAILGEFEIAELETDNNPDAQQIGKKMGVGINMVPGIIVIDKNGVKKEIIGFDTFDHFLEEL